MPVPSYRNFFFHYEQTSSHAYLWGTFRIRTRELSQMSTFLFEIIDKSVNNIRDFKWKNLASFIRSEFLKAQNLLTSSFGYFHVVFYYKRKQFCSARRLNNLRNLVCTKTDYFCDWFKTSFYWLTGYHRYNIS